MATIPQKAAREHIKGLPPPKRGKVRDTYKGLRTCRGLTSNQTLLPVATDRISAFDFVLPCEVRQKGEILTAMNIFWRTGPLKAVIGKRHDLVAYGSDIDEFLSESLRGNPDIQKRSMVILRKKMAGFEGIPRGYLVGTGLEAYNDTNPHVVCGYPLPDGLHDGSKLAKHLFTTTTKAKFGHDVHIPVSQVVKRYGKGPMQLGLELYDAATAYAESRGILIADTKFEFWIDADGTVGIGDEVLTPDSSRFWLAFMYALAQEKKKSPQGMDKQYVRDYLKSLNIDLLDPTNPKHLKRLADLEIPRSLLEVTSLLYRYAFWALTGSKIEAFQRHEMGIAVSDVKPWVDIVIGSTSDEWQIKEAVDLLKGRANYRVTVLSCHRHDDKEEKLERFVQHELTQRTTHVLSGAGEAAALPGILKTKLCKYDRFYVPVLGVGCKGKNREADMAARLSVKRLPGQPVELSTNGQAYFGPKGFKAAARAILEQEFYPRKIEARPAVFGLWNLALSV